MAVFMDAGDSMVIMVAARAFALGTDKDDISFKYNAGMPVSLLD